MPDKTRTVFSNWHLVCMSSVNNMVTGICDLELASILLQFALLLDGIESNLVYG